MKKTILALVLTASAVSLTAAQLVEAIVIRVGDRVVTRTQYARRLHDAFTEIDQTSTTPADAASKKEELRKNLSTDLIAELLIKDRADRLGLSVAADELKDAMSRLKEQYGIKTDAEFDESLRKSGMTRADMEARLHDTILMNKVFGRELRQRDELTDKELKERYDREKERYRLPERARLREIIVIKPSDASKVEAARERANALTAQARTGDFAKLATTSSDAGTKEKGGDLGEVARGELLPDLDKAVFNATAGTVLGPIETKSGWHILKVETRLPSEVPAFESVKDRLRKDASDDTWQRDYKAYIDRLRKDAFIQINEQNVPTS
ncbi:MAG: peptidylprolyl isomerase [Acidobacteria bacterium]|nr:peptidylprolyl isomerase [Acidobacteriota bacterium]MBV9067543.1 peptidylprolyl isomerase [Acidobacteriota bacterium]MBV9184457.1 peptidylprolyl isomerase [Acidobacteriota bacterium]